MKFRIFVFSSSTEALPNYIMEIQHVRMFRVSYPSRPDHLPNDLNEESVVFLRITICDAPRQMLTNVILLCIYTWYV